MVILGGSILYLEYFLFLGIVDGVVELLLYDYINVFSIVVNVLYCDVDSIVVGCCVGASRWLAWCYKVV